MTSPSVLKSSTSVSGSDDTVLRNGLRKSGMSSDL